MDGGFLQSFDESILPWERGVRKGGYMYKKIMAENLLDFKEVLDKYNIPFVFIFGTLLGVVRKGDFIDCDTDVDVACFNEFTRKDHCKMRDVKEELFIKGFDVVDSNLCPLHNDYFIRGGEKIEIWWFDKIDDEWIFGDTLRYNKIFFDFTEEIDFLGTKFLIPNSPEKFLELTYGKDWRTPNPKGHWLNQNPKEVRKRNEQK